MLDHLMSMLNRGGTLTLDQIASELDTTPEMIQQLIKCLERNDLLKQMGGECQTTCDGCYLASACTRSAAQRLWSRIN